MKTDGSEWMVAVWGTRWQCSYRLKTREVKGQGSGDGKWSCQHTEWWQRCFCQDMKRHTWNSIIPIFANLQIIHSANDILLYISSKKILFFLLCFLFPTMGLKMLGGGSEKERWGAVAWLFSPVWKPRGTLSLFLQKPQICFWQHGVDNNLAKASSL